MSCETFPGNARKLLVGLCFAQSNQGQEVLENPSTSAEQAMLFKLEAPMLRTQISKGWNVRKCTSHIISPLPGHPVTHCQKRGIGLAQNELQGGKTMKLVH